MNQKQFSAIAGVLFLLIVVLHLLRLVFGWEAVIGSWTVPIWVSWVAIVLFGFLAYTAFKLGK